MGPADTQLMQTRTQERLTSVDKLLQLYACSGASHLILPKIIDVVIHNSKRAPPRMQRRDSHLATVVDATVACIPPQLGCEILGKV